MFAWSGAPGEAPIASSDTGPYPSPNAYAGYQESQSRRKVDAIAEAWGTHEPEPYQEFFAGGGVRPDSNTPASSIHNGKEKHSRKKDDDHRTFLIFFTYCLLF